MTLFDYIFILILIFSFFISYLKGFINQIISILKWVLALLISKLFYQDMSKLFLNYINNVLFANIISFIVMFLIIFIIASIIGILLTNLLKSIGMGKINSILGGILGIIKSTIFITLILILLSLTDIIKQDFIINSLSYYYFKYMIQLVMPYMPNFVQQNTKISFQSNI